MSEWGEGGVGGGGGGGLLSLKEPSEVKDVLINSYGKPQGVMVL